MPEISAELSSPRALSLAPTAARDLAECRAILAAGSKSFAAAGRVLPPSVRDDAAALYAFCRFADDAVDDARDPARGVELVRGRLDLVYRGTPHDSPVDRAFTRVVEALQLPRVVPDALVEGFAWDAAGRRYETLDDTIAYGVRVASTVGLMMSMLLGCRARGTLSRAAELGIAMQLTNIARDVGEDARRGRVYLPEAWLRGAGVDPEALRRNPAPGPALGAVVRRILDQADVHYARADVGVRELPQRVRVAIRAARLIYADIGRVIAARGYDSVSGRAVVSGPRKLWLVARALPAWRWRPTGEQTPETAATRFLLDAIAPEAPR
jgi:phytoene synthase